MNAGNVQDLSSRELLELFLSEVNSLSIRLRHPVSRHRSSEDLPAAARTVLRILHNEGPLSVPHIARLKTTSRQNVQTIINRLKKARLVQLASNPAHKRSGLVFITEAGRAALGRDVGWYPAELESLASEIARGELISLLRLLRKLREAFGAGHPQSRSRAEQPAASVRREERKAERRTAKTEPDRQKPEPESHEGELPVNLL